MPAETSLHQLNRLQRSFRPVCQRASSSRRQHERQDQHLAVNRGMPRVRSFFIARHSSLSRAFIAVALLLAHADQGMSEWPQWRGPLGTGVAPNSNPPTEWDSENNHRWKTKIDGEGHSTPIVSDDLIFVTTAVPIGPALAPRASGRPGAHDNRMVTSMYEFQAWAIDLKTGAVQWKKTLTRAIPLEGGHNTASLASASPVTDGERFFAYFGSHGLYCLNREGEVLWKKDLGKMHTKHGHGEGASPALHGNTIVVNWDHEGDSFLAAFNTSNGLQRWRVERNEVTSWSTPVITTVDGEPQVIVCGTDKIRGYRLLNGQVIWECGGMSANIVATPLVSDGILYAGSSYEKRILMAIRLAEAQGDITDTEHVLWSRFRGTPYVPSPLIYKDALYFLTHYQNVLTRINAKTGTDSPGAFRLGPLTNIYASPVAANGNLYITDLDGQTLVMTATEIPRALSLNPIGEPVSASLAVVGSLILIRGAEHLHCIGER